MPGLLNRAPHSNAAKVFINWLLSREGQALFQKVISVPGDPRNSRRIDVPKDHIPADEQRRDKMTYFDTDDPDTKDLNPAMKLLDEILVAKKIAKQSGRCISATSSHEVTRISPLGIEMTNSEFEITRPALFFFLFP
jgi:hypothetical protein